MFSVLQDVGDSVPLSHTRSPNKNPYYKEIPRPLQEYIQRVRYEQRSLGLDSHSIFSRAGTTPSDAVNYVPLIKRRNNNRYDPTRIPVVSNAGTDYFIVIDYECTCDEPQLENHEIIEFPAVLVDAKTLNIHSVFHSFVKPIETPILSDYCRNLTGITQEEVDNAPPLPVVLTLFRAWLRSNGIWLPMRATNCANIISENVQRDDGSTFERFVVNDEDRALYLRRVAARNAAAETTAADCNSNPNNPTEPTSAQITEQTESVGTGSLVEKLSAMTLTSNSTHGATATPHGKDGYGGGHSGSLSPPGISPYNSQNLSASSSQSTRDNPYLFENTQAAAAQSMKTFAAKTREALNEAEATLYSRLVTYIDRFPHTESHVIDEQGLSTRAAPTHPRYVPWDAVLVPQRARGTWLSECVLSSPLQRVSNGALVAYCREEAKVEVEALLAVQRRAVLHDYCRERGWIGKNDASPENEEVPRGAAALAHASASGLTEDSYLSMVMSHHPTVSMAQSSSFPRNMIPGVNITLPSDSAPTWRNGSVSRPFHPEGAIVQEIMKVRNSVRDAVGAQPAKDRDRGAARRNKDASDGQESGEGCVRKPIAGHVMTSYDNTAMLATDGPWDLGKFLVPECYHKRISGLLCDALGMSWQISIDSGYFSRLCYELACAGVDVRRRVAESSTAATINEIPVPEGAMGFGQTVLAVEKENLQNTPAAHVDVLAKANGGTVTVVDNPYRTNAPLLQAIDIRGHLRRLSNKHKLPFLYSSKNGFNVTSVLTEFCLTFQGREHCGLADTLNIARILMCLSRHSQISLVPNMQKALDESLV